MGPETSKTPWCRMYVYRPHPDPNVPYRALLCHGGGDQPPCRDLEHCHPGVMVQERPDKGGAALAVALLKRESATQSQETAREMMMHWLTIRDLQVRALVRRLNQWGYQVADSEVRAWLREERRLGRVQYIAGRGYRRS